MAPIMHLTTQEHIAAPPGAVFDVLCEVDVYERAAQRQGIDVRWRDGPASFAPGMIWDLSVSVAGEERAATLEVAEAERPNLIVVDLSSKGFTGSLSIHVRPTPPDHTCLDVACSIRATTLKTRIVLKSADLARSKLEAAFCKRARQLVDDLRDRLAKRV